MNEFKNKLIIKEEPYKWSFLDPIPEFGKHGSAIILSGGLKDDIIVDEHTTSKEIRQSKYTKKIEVSTLPYINELHFSSPSKESAFSFDIYVKAVIQVNDPILFYQNKNIDVDAYFEKLFSLDVKKITKCYSILDYNGMDEELTNKLSSFNEIDQATGFTYQVSAVDASPGQEAKQYVYQYSKQQLDAGLKQNARSLSGSYSMMYEDAIRTEVAEGKLTEAEAIKKIEEDRTNKFQNQLKQLEELREKGFLTDRDAKNLIAPALEGIGVKISTEKSLDYDKPKNIEIDNFYNEDDE